MQGKYFEAEELGERVLSLRIRELKSTHPFCYVSKLYLAWLYNETGRCEKAEDVDIERAKSAKAKAFDRLSGKESMNDVDLIKFRRKLERAELRLRIANLK